MKILLTGASGFVGSRLQQVWKNPDELVPVSLRYGDSNLASINWTEIKAVIHLGGLAHQTGSIREEEYFRANEALTVNLAKEAKENGVKNFIFLSTIKVFGNHIDKIPKASTPKPDDAYGQSKFNAELALQELSDQCFQVAIIRPPLIVGSGAKGNLLSLLQLLKNPLPLPFGNIQNKRSMLSLVGLIQVIQDLVLNPQNGIFHVSNEPISTTEICENIRSTMGFKSPRLFGFPGFFRKIIRLLNPAMYQRLFGNLVVENPDITTDHSLDEAIRAMVKEFEGTT